jgi:acyl-CoA synthetase (AMP-forming)/AMP-acid ligase II
MFTVPTILKALVEHPAVDRVDHSSLRHVIYAGAPMYRADQLLALRKLGPCLVQYFGLGEVTGNITVLRADQHSLDEDNGGLPHPRWGESGVAAVVARPGQDVTEGDVLAHLSDRLSRYKQPLRVVVWDALPKSGYGKIPKRLVQDRLREEGVTF